MIHLEKGVNLPLHDPLAYLLGSPLEARKTVVLYLVMRHISRLPRRFDSTMTTLRALMKSKSERVRLAAVLRASEILLEHQRGEERAAIAIERAQARKAEAEAPTTAEPGEQPPVSREDALRDAEAFLARIREKESANAAQ